MEPGVRAELQVSSPPRCGLLDVVGDATIRSVSRTSHPDGEGVVVEFVTDARIEGAEKVFDYGTDAVYRVPGSVDRPCVRERIERMGYPIREHRVEGGVVTLAFFVPDIAALRSVVEALTADGCLVSVQRLTRSGADADPEPVVVDRSALTDRQTEVLRTAAVMGYFEHPKEANGGEVADELDITTSTFVEHLSAAQRKLLEAVLE